MALNWFYLCLAIIAEVIATSSLKSTLGFTKLWPSVIVVVSYGAAFFFLSLTLRSIPIGIAYAIWAGVGVALVTGIAWVFFDQKLDLAAVIGIALIVSGVVVLNVFSKVSGH